MNRRTVFKGAAASSALMFSMRLGMHRTRAQAPAYTAEVIYEFTEFKGDAYMLVDDGFLWGVTSDGIITGRDRVDGVLRPVTWDLTGTRTLLDTGDIQVGTTSAVVPGPAGFILGNVKDVDSPDAPTVGVLWTNGTPALVDPNPAGSINTNAVNSSGLVVGAMGSAPARWAGGQVEQLPVPDSASSASIVNLNEDGDGFGIARTDDGAVSELFMWMRGGTVEAFPFPEEVSGNGLEAVRLAVIPAFFGNGEFVLSLSWEDASGSTGGSWLYQSGVPQRVASSAEDTYAAVRYALEPGTMIGGMNHGAGEATGFTGPTIWVDGVPYSLLDLTTFPDGISISLTRGIAADGTLVASTLSAGEGIPPNYILALRPS